MAPLKVEEVSTRAELDAVAECIWAVMAESDNSHKVFFPVLDGVAAGLANCQERLWNEHTADSTSHWIFVRDPSSTGLRILGACQWRLYEQNPFPHGTPHIKATWWPAGEGRRFATSFIMQCLTPRAEWMARPHSGLTWCVVLPDQQRKGIGRALMSWGLDRTDHLGVESYIEATPAGRKLYERFGFRKVARVDVKMNGEPKSAEWSELESSLLPSGYDSMWRPVHGVWSADEPRATWSSRIAGFEWSNTQTS